MSEGKGRALPKVLTEDESRALLEQFDTRWKTPHRDLCMTRLMLEAGLRAGEVVSLKRDHLDMMTCRLVVREGKGARDRVLWITDDLRDLIGEWLSRKDPECSWLFPTRSGRRVATSHLRSKIKRLAKKAGISEWEKVSPHTLRHTFATNLLKRTKNIRLVQRALGHADISSTMIYTHITDDELQEALRYTHMPASQVYGEENP